MTTPTPRTDAYDLQSDDNYFEAIEFARQLERDLAATQEWREAVLNELILAHIYTKEHDTNPRKAVQDAITWNCQVALDPAVSSDARKLIAQERERCAKIVGTYQVPVGNSPAGELACDWTMDALREIDAAIRRGD